MSESRLLTTLPINSCNDLSKFLLFSSGIICCTAILFFVIVPVLSTQSTLTLASVSTHTISCTTTFFFPSRITLTTRATLASRYKPSGIIPTRAAITATTLSFKDIPIKKYSCTNIIIPIGIMSIPIISTSLLSDFIISVC